MAEPSRCGWARTALSVPYHDREWGTPLHDDRVLFEFIVLEGAQAGLSWETILAKRHSYRAAFDGFDPARVAAYGPEKIAELLGNAGVVRNRLKIAAAIENARAFRAIQAEHGSFDRWLWRFVDGEPRQPGRRSPVEVPARTPESDALSKALQQRGFRFVGSTICYAFMQAVGMVNDHVVDCFRYAELGGIPPSSGSCKVSV